MLKFPAALTQRLAKAQRNARPQRSAHARARERRTRKLTLGMSRALKRPMAGSCGLALVAAWAGLFAGVWAGTSSPRAMWPSTKRSHTSGNLPTCSVAATKSRCAQRSRRRTNINTSLPLFVPCTTSSTFYHYQCVLQLPAPLATPPESGLGSLSAHLAESCAMRCAAAVWARSAPAQEATRLPCEVHVQRAVTRRSGPAGRQRIAGLVQKRQVACRRTSTGVAPHPAPASSACAPGSVSGSARGSPRSGEPSQARLMRGTQDQAEARRSSQRRGRGWPFIRGGRSVEYRQTHHQRRRRRDRCQRPHLLQRVRDAGTQARSAPAAPHLRWSSGGPDKRSSPRLPRRRRGDGQANDKS